MKLEVNYHKCLIPSLSQKSGEAETSAKAPPPLEEMSIDSPETSYTRRGSSFALERSAAEGTPVKTSATKRKTKSSSSAREGLGERHVWQLSPVGADNFKLFPPSRQMVCENCFLSLSELAQKALSTRITFKRYCHQCHLKLPCPRTQFL